MRSKTDRIYGDQLRFARNEYEVVLLLDRPLGHRRKRLLLRLQFVEDHLNRLVELLVDPCKLPRRIVVHDDVRIDAVAFHDPSLAEEAVSRELGFIQEAPVEQGESAADSDHAPPCALPDQVP